MSKLRNIKYQVIKKGIKELLNCQMLFRFGAV
jgi:hypothetical protein